MAQRLKSAIQQEVQANIKSRDKLRERRKKNSGSESLIFGWCTKIIAA